MSKFASLISHIEYLVTQDETELALKCFDMVPAFHRDNRDRDLQKLKAEILCKMLMPIELQHDNRELPKSKEHSVSFLNATARGQLLKEELTKANEIGVTPHIVDFGPGDFTFAIGLHSLGMKFTYEPISFHYVGLGFLKDILGDCLTRKPGVESPHWFVAYEIIEHLADTSEIQQLLERLNKRPSKAFLSTPKYTFGTGTPNWRTEGIHHRRAYTPQEFIFESAKMLQGYKLQFIDNEVMCLLGEINE